MRYIISVDHAPPAGTLRHLGPTDTVTVHRSATRRDDWGPLSSAVMTAYARGAHVRLVDDVEQETGRG